MSPNNFNRVRIKLVVSLVPGIHLRALQRLLGTSFNTVRYHVRSLAREGEISCERERGFARLYPGDSASSDRMVYSAMSSRISRRIVSALVERGSMSNKQLCEATGLAKSTISEHLHRFIDAGMIKKVISADCHSAYALSDSEGALRVLRSLEESPVRIVVSNFTDLWDF